MASCAARARARISRSRLCARAFVVSGLLWPAGPAAAELAPQSRMEWAPQNIRGHCEIRFSGSSTLHDFSGEVRSRPFELGAVVDEIGGPAWWSGSVEVAVAEMDTGIARRDRKMRAMFDADRFPLIVASFPNVGGATLAAARSGGEPDLAFDLTIRDVKRPVVAKVSNWTEEAERSSFDVDFELSLEAFGLEVPPVLGLLRVGDAVGVHAHVILDELTEGRPETAAFDGSPGSLPPRS